MEPVSDQESTEVRTAEDPNTATNPDTSDTSIASGPDLERLEQHADEFNGAFKSVLQAYRDQQQILLQRINQADELGNQVKVLTGDVQTAEQQIQKLAAESNRKTAELETRTDELTSALKESEDKSRELDERGRIIDCINASIQDFEARCASLEIRARVADELEVKVPTLNTEIQNLTTTLQNTENRYQALETEARQKAIEIDKQAEQLAAAHLSLGEQHQQLEAQTRLVGEMNSNNERLSAELQGSERSRQQLETQTSQQATEITNQAEQLSELRNTTEDQRHQLEARDLQIAEMGSNIGRLTAELQNSEKSRQQLDARTSQQATEISDQAEQLSAARTAAQEQHQRLERRAQESIDLNSEVVRLSAALQESEKRCQHLEEQSGQKAANLDSQVDELAAIMETHTSEVDNLKATVNEYQQRCQSLECRAGRAAGLEQEIERLTTVLKAAEEGYKQQLDVQSNEIEQLKTTVSEQQQHRDEHGVQTSETHEQDSEIERLASRLRASEEHAHQLQLTAEQNIALLNSRVEELTVELQAATERSRSMETETCSPETPDSEVVALKEEIERLAIKLEKRTGQANQFRDKVSGLYSEIERLTSMLEAHDINGDTSHSREAELTSQVEQLKASLSESQSNHQDLLERASQVDVLNSKVESLTTALQENEDHQKQLVEHSNRKVKELYSQIEELNISLRAAQDHQQPAEARQGIETGPAAHIQDERINELTRQLEAKTSEMEQLEVTVSDYAQRCQLLEERTSLPVDQEQEINALKAELQTANSQLKHLADTATGHNSQVTHTAADSQALDAKMEELKSLDMLTGMQNRHSFMKALEERLTNGISERDKQAVIYVLLDNFMAIREKIGIVASDQAVADISTIIANNCAESDIASRFGDFSFAVLYHNENLEKILARAEKICRDIDEHVLDVEGDVILTTASIGVCVLNEYTTDAQKVITRADLACEVARSSGGNQVHTHSTIIDEQMDQENVHDWSEVIRKTIDDERFYLVYQPIISLKDVAGKRYEVLLRIVDQDGKIILPGEFISIAEKIGLNMEIDQWVIDAALRKLSECNDDDTTYFIKLSGNSIGDSDFVSWIERKLVEYNTTRQNVVFEIPESVAIDNLKNTMSFSKAMQAMQCRVALEHYACTTKPQLLKHVTVNILKIDSSLVRNLDSNTENQAKVRAIIDRAREHDLVCVAERVDDASALAKLWELGVDFVQGNFVHEPAREPDFDFSGEQETQEFVSCDLSGLPEL